MAKQISIKTRSIILILSLITGLLVNASEVVVRSWVDRRFGDESSAVDVFVYILYKAMFPILGYIIIAGGVIFFAWPWLKEFFILRETSFSLTGGGLELKYRPEMEDAIKRIQNEPEKVKPAWDLARLKLELYFNRNLSQINSIFWLSVVVMLVGFVFILFGISLAFTQQSINTQGINGTSANA